MEEDYKNKLIEEFLQSEIKGSEYILGTGIVEKFINFLEQKFDFVKKENEENKLGLEPITESEDSDLTETWFEDAKGQTLETLPEIMDRLMNGYRYDYGTITRAIAACSVAAVDACNSSEQGDITGFQAGYVMWDFIRYWNYETNKCGLVIVDYDKMLYPQYHSVFANFMRQDTMEKLMARAKELLEENKEEDINPRLRAHWMSIAAGIPPFGYILQDPRIQ